MRALDPIPFAPSSLLSATNLLLFQLSQKKIIKIYVTAISQLPTCSLIAILVVCVKYGSFAFISNWHESWSNATRIKFLLKESYLIFL